MWRGMWLGVGLVSAAALALCIVLHLPPVATGAIGGGASFAVVLPMVIVGLRANNQQIATLRSVLAHNRPGVPGALFRTDLPGGGCRWAVVYSHNLGDIEARFPELVRCNVRPVSLDDRSWETLLRCPLDPDNDPEAMVEFTKGHRGFPPSPKPATPAGAWESFGADGGTCHSADLVRQLAVSA
jgi:hypothetical protein